MRRAAEWFLKDDIRSRMKILRLNRDYQFVGHIKDFRGAEVSISDVRPAAFLIQSPICVTNGRALSAITLIFRKSVLLIQFFKDRNIGKIDYFQKF